MKKRKFSWLLNIATICLCVCAIAIGVYSATTASLTVSGSIGFNAHNCIVEISGSYKACSSTTATSRTPTNLETTTVGGTESATKEIKSLSLFFSDYATDGDEIVFNLTITNKSDFKITVKAPAPILTTASGDAITSVTCTSSNEKFTLEAKDEDGSSATITLTYKLEDIDNAVDITDGQFSISLNFEKWSQYYTDKVTEYISDNRGHTAVTTTKLCTTMGHSIKGTGTGKDGETEIPIQWYAFAVRGDKTSDNNFNTKPTAIFGDATPLSIENSYIENGTQINETWYSLYGVDMSKVNYKGYTFWFIQQYVTAGGYHMGTDASSYVDGVQFDSSDNKYASSSIYTYLTDTTTSTNYLSLTGIKDDGLFNSVEERSVSESYSVDFTADYVKEGSYTSEFSSKLWLISVAELGLIINTRVTIEMSGYPHGVKTPGIGNQDLSNSYSKFDELGYGAGWRLRSPAKYSKASWFDISSEGYIETYPLSKFNFGVRSAFQITI